ncbi:MAG: C2H2-type zinc finger protein [SAR202 cluster bacterium]|nr:C2H2-type zinc finger protein [SAR202 cluster bacterium]
MVACSICKKNFSSKYNLNRHINTMHPLDVDDDDVGDVDNNVLDESNNNDACEAVKMREEEKKEEGNGDDDDNGKTIWEVYSNETGELESPIDKRKFVLKRYIKDIEYYNQFRRDPIHKNIMATKRKFLNDADENENLSDYEALRLAITKRQYLINNVTNLENDNKVEKN